LLFRKKEKNQHDTLNSKNMKPFRNTLAVLTVMVIAAMTGCKKNGANGYMSVIMTDAPAIYTSVYVDIRSVEVHYTNEQQGTSGWAKLNTNSGVYDLLKLQNNAAATIAANTKLPVGEITQLRLILGTNNSVIISGDSQHTLKVPSEYNTGIKINVNSSITSGQQLVIILDFNAEKSIVAEGNGDFSLKPVIEIKSVVQY
jgi:hypothetical protein